jgi:NDP-sugar pyrophosphorylase family protein
MATMAVMRSSLGRETPNCVVHDDTVTAYSKSPTPVDAEFIDYGMLVFSKAAFSEFKGSDLSKLQTELATAGALTAFEVEVPYTEIGTPDSLAAAESDLRPGA